LLSKSMKKYVLNKEKNGYSKEMQNVYDDRLEVYALKAIKDLTLLADKLPEAQQAGIFNDKTMGPLFRSLFKFLSEAANQPQSIQKADKKTGEEEKQERRSRVLLLCHEAVNEIGDTMNARSLAPYEMNVLLFAGQNSVLPALTGTNAVYIKGLSLDH